MKRLVLLFSLILSIGVQSVAEAQVAGGAKNRKYFPTPSMPTTLNLDNGNNIDIYGNRKKLGLSGYQPRKSLLSPANNYLNVEHIGCDNIPPKPASCDPMISDIVMKHIDFSLKVSYYSTNAQCYNKTKRCETTPDIASICSCLEGKETDSEKEGKKRFEEIKKGFANSGDAMTRMFNKSLAEISYKQLIDNKDKVDWCVSSNKALLTAEQKKECDEALARQEESAKNIKQTAASAEKDTGSNVEARDKVRSSEQKSCLSKEDYLAAKFFPTKQAFVFIKPQSNDKSFLEGHRIILMGMLEGKSLFEIGNTEGLDSKAKGGLEKAIQHYYTQPSQLKEMSLFAKQNPFWKELLVNAKDQKNKKDVLDEFTEIYQSSVTSDMVNKYRSFSNRPEVKAAMIEANKKTAQLIESYSGDKGILKTKPQAIYGNFNALNTINKASGKVMPLTCSNIADRMQGNNVNVDLVLGGSTLTTVNLSNCQNSFMEICANYKQGQSLSADPVTPEENEIVSLATNHFETISDYEQTKMWYYNEAVEKVCNTPHKLNKAFSKVGRGITYNEFAAAVCKGEKIDNAAISYQFPSEEIKKAACGDGENANKVLGNLYMSSFENQSVLSDGSDMRAVAKLKTNAEVFDETTRNENYINQVAGNISTDRDEGDSEYCGIMCALGKMRESSSSTGVVAGASPSGSTTSPSFIDGLASGMTKAATTISGPAVESNVQSYMNGVMPITSVLPADLNNADPSQLSYAKRSVDNGISDLEKRLDNYEKKEEQSYSVSQNQEISLLKKQIEELRQQSELLKSQLDKEKETKVADKAVESPAAGAGSRSPASTGDYKSSVPHVSSATQQAANNQNLQPSKIFENSYSDGSFHNVPTLGSSKSIDSKAFNSRSSNDALLSIYTDKTVSNLVDAVASSSNSNILVVGNALEMQEATVKDKKFQTKEIVIDQSRLEQVRSNPESLKSLIEENKIRNHVGILTLKTGESQLNYIMRKDDAGKLVILPLNIARKVTLDSLKNELINN